MTQPSGKIHRRKWLKRAMKLGAGLAALPVSTVGYGYWEASRIRILRRTVHLPHLPPEFDGMTIAVLADLHHGPLVSLSFIRQATELAQSLSADAYALVGDFGHRGTHTDVELPPCLEVMERLKAPLGVYAVPGNHDMMHGGAVYRDIVAQTSITDLTNRTICLGSGAEKLWIAGVDDLYWGKPNVNTAVHGIPNRSAVILLAHNPDFAELSPDPRVGLMLSGHTHGGQIYVPRLGARWLPSRYGEKYRAGLVRGPASQVFVSRGLRESGIPLRLNCPPEINLLTLVTRLPWGDGTHRHNLQHAS
ncbi:MAG: metallophosphoesterase [Planctomycetota bacterium]|nr:metallophosphoesterase [Planctomycetota bacterium]MDA1179108.1 metallophosphoesterase [Planctomycetota bacterium]